MPDLNNLKNTLKESGTKFPIYLDYQSTTPVDSRVIEEMIPYFNDKFGNADSKGHKFGWETEAAVDIARQKVANTINADHESIIFTSSATESNNLALLGTKHLYDHVITLATEHKSVLEPIYHLQNLGIKSTILPVQQNGLVDLNLLEGSITSEKTLISIMTVNNEIGIIQPTKEIGLICKKHNILFHTDIAQSFGKVPLDVNECNIDLASISGHKIYGPKGIGALYVRNKLDIKPIMYGGMQEYGIRPSTLPTALIVGLGKASEIAISEMNLNYGHIKELYEYFVKNIIDSKITINGSIDIRWPGNINITLPKHDVRMLRDIAISHGSACSSGKISHVLKALDLNDIEIKNTIRIGIGKDTTLEEINYTVALLKETISN